MMKSVKTSPGLVAISNGHDKFILAPLAAELAERNRLAYLLTGGYPGKSLRPLLHLIAPWSSSIKRFAARHEPGVPDSKVFSMVLSEAFSQCSHWLKGEHAELAKVHSLVRYSKSAARVIRRESASIYHYRSGYGLMSLSTAKACGMALVCDHSIANPEILTQLVRENGHWPRTIATTISPLEHAMLSDLRAADYIIVNSDFVKESFTRFGWDESRFFVNYTGIDDSFKASMPSRRDRVIGKSLRILFASSFNERKGARVLADSLKYLEGFDFHLDIVGDVSNAMHDVASAMRNDDRVHFHGPVFRNRLAEMMNSADVFVLPTLAEGSARVIFMAMACGCYIITTPNAGSIVESGVHGETTEPGSPYKLAKAIEGAIRRRDEIDQVSILNQSIVLTEYTQRRYGERACRIYDEILARRNFA